MLEIPKLDRPAGWARAAVCSARASSWIRCWKRDEQAASSAQVPAQTRSRSERTMRMCAVGIRLQFTGLTMVKTPPSPAAGASRLQARRRSRMPSVARASQWGPGAGSNESPARSSGTSACRRSRRSAGPATVPTSTKRSRPDKQRCTSDIPPSSTRALASRSRPSGKPRMSIIPMGTTSSSKGIGAAPSRSTIVARARNRNSRRPADAATASAV